MFWIVGIVVIVLLIVHFSIQADRRNRSGIPDGASPAVRIALWMALVAVVSRLIGRSERR